MSSLITKVNKSGSSGLGKVRSSKGKKAASKKPQRPGAITAAAKAKKAAPSKSTKKSASAKKISSVSAKKAQSKKVLPKKVASKAAPSKGVKRAAAKQPAQKKPDLKNKKAPAKVIQAPPKKTPAPRTLAAVQAFEQALKVFNRHDYAAARTAFQNIVAKFGDMAEIVAHIRTYLAICEQRLARTPSVPRNPDALYNQGVFELNKGNVREAIDLFDKALRAEPRADHVLYSLAAAHARLNDTQKAMDALRRAISLRSVHRSHARRDLDFASLRSNEDFQQLTGFDFEYIEE